MKAFLPSSSVRLRFLIAAIVGFLLIQPAFAFFPEPTPIVMSVGQSIVIKVKGLPASAAVVLQTVNLGTPGVVTSDHVGTESGTGFVLVTITATGPGVTSVSFIGTNNGNLVSGSINVTVLGFVGSSGQNGAFATAGDPINTSNGEYFAFESLDMSLGGPMPLTFSRYVASGLQSDGVANALMGQNRLHNFASKIIPVNATHKRVVLPNGRTLLFQKVGTKWVLQRPLDVAYIFAESGTNFVLGHPDSRQIWTYDNNNQLIKIEDGKGNVHTLAYTSNRLSSVTDGLGRSLTFTYTSNLLTKVVDQNAREVNFTYTGGVLTSASDIGGHITSYANSGGLPTSITRPETNVLFTQTYTGGKVTSQTERGDTSNLSYGAGTTEFTDPTGEVMTDTYDSNGRLTSHADQSTNSIPMTYDAAGRRSSVTDRAGDKTTLVYHAPSGQPATITNAEGKATTMAYKSRTVSGLMFHDLAKITYPDGSSETFSYDAKGNLTQVTDQAGKMWKFTYNTRGQALTATNPLMGVTTYTYDAFGNIATAQAPDMGVTTYTHDAFNRLTQITRPGGATVIIAYDAKDRINTITDERGKIYDYDYDDNDRVTTVTDPDTFNTAYAYDDLDRLTQITDRRGKISGVTYNSRKLPASFTDGNNNTITIQYDNRQRPSAVLDAGNQSWSTFFDVESIPTFSAAPGEPQTEVRLNKMGQPVQRINPLGHIERWVRDPMQRVIQAFDALGRLTTYAYDKAGRLISATEQGIGTAKYDRDGLGNVTKVTDPGGGIWAQTYSKGGRPLVSTDALGKKWSRTYDTRGRLLTTTYPDASTCTLTYDAADNITGRQHSAGPNLLYTYDNLGRIATADGVTLTYDAEGHLTNAEQGGLDFNATYDDGGRLATVSYSDAAVVVTYLYDTRNRLTKVSDSISGAVIDFTYDNAGRLTLMERSNGVDATYTYDDDGRLTRIQDGSFIDLQYTYNAAGDIVLLDSTTPLAPAVSALAQTFKFGKASQVTTTGYVYDLRGRLTAAPGDVFGWDGAGRLTNADGVTLTYNGFHDVMQRTVGANVTRFYNHYALGLAPIVHEDAPTGSDRSYVWTPDGQLLYSIDTTSMQPTFYHFDHIGSTLALTSSAGAVTDSYAYGPFGEPMQHVGTSTQPFTYVGAYGVRAEGNLYQMRQRYYDPVTARFLSRDPLPPELESPQTINPYQYATNDPLAYIDPEGLKRKKRRSRGPCGPPPTTPAERRARRGQHADAPVFLVKPSFGPTTNACDFANPPPGGGCTAGFPSIAPPVGYGITDKLEVGVSSGFSLNQFDKKVSLCNYGVFSVLETPAKLSFPTANAPLVLDESGSVFNIGNDPGDPGAGTGPAATRTPTAGEQAIVDQMLNVYRHLQAVGSDLLDKFAKAGYNDKTIRDQISAVDKARDAVGEYIKALGGTPPPPPM